jgi:hypothetical protein
MPEHEHTIIVAGVCIGCGKRVLDELFEETP